MVHVGINDIEKVDFQSLIRDIDDAINGIHAKFPTATIYISSLIKRKDNEFEVEINKTNLFINSYLTKNNYVKIMDNSKILPHMLYDEKHLNRNGFKIFLGNIRFLLFNMSQIIIMVTTNVITKGYQGTTNTSMRKTISDLKLASAVYSYHRIYTFKTLIFLFNFYAHVYIIS